MLTRRKASAGIAAATLALTASNAARAEDAAEQAVAGAALLGRHASDRRAEAAPFDARLFRPSA